MTCTTCLQHTTGQVKELPSVVVALYELKVALFLIQYTLFLKKMGYAPFYMLNAIFWLLFFDHVVV